MSDSNELQAPLIHAIVQIRAGRGWDYTGEVIEHHPEHPTWFKVFWHKWNNSEDNATLTGWEYNMNNCRVITSPQPGQWWPSTPNTDTPSTTDTQPTSSPGVVEIDLNEIDITITLTAAQLRALGSFTRNWMVESHEYEYQPTSNHIEIVSTAFETMIDAFDQAGLPELALRAGFWHTAVSNLTPEDDNNDEDDIA